MVVAKRLWTCHTFRGLREKCFRATQLENDNNRFIIFYPLKAAARTDHFKEAIRMFQW